MTTRRDILKSGAGLAAILAAQSAPAIPVRSMVAARGSFLGRGAGGGGWVNPYVTDGLVAMWDGEWNAGGGVHDGSIENEWTDIVGGMKFSAQYGSSYFSDKRIVLSGCVLKGLTGALAAPLSDARFTVEYVIPVCTDERGYVFWRYPPYSNPSIEIQRNGTNWVSYCDTASGHFNGLPSDKTFREFVVDGSSWKMCCNDVVSAKTISFTQRIFSHSAGLALLGSAQGSSNYYFTGEACAIRFYSRPLSAAEIAANYAVDKQRFNLT